MSAGTIVAALLLPPLGVWLSEGVGRNFWIALVLTILAFVPGVIFALVVVLQPNLLAPRRIAPAATG